MSLASPIPSVRTHYLDASAIVKLLIAEEGSNAIREYLGRHGAPMTTSLCFAEALGVLKSKFVRKILSQEEYLNACEDLLARVRNNSLELDDVGISQRRTFDEVELLAKKHSLDVSDAYQLVTLRRGLYSPLEGESRPILITADKSLARAAQKEGMRVWDCLRESPP